MAIALALAACGDDPAQSGLSQLADSRSMLELGATATEPTTTTEPDVVDDTTVPPDTSVDTTPDTSVDTSVDTSTDTSADRDSTSPADSDTSVETDIAGPCAGIDCDDDDPCTEDRCIPETGECDREPVVCAPSEDPCQLSFCDRFADGCSIKPVTGPKDCNDGVACTIEDRCEQGVCVGELKSCDDLDPCTTDACIDGGCTATAIPNCVPDLQCVTALPGAHCDDGSSTTGADLCLAGTCRGFAATRVSAALVEDAIGLVVTEIDFGPPGWTSVFWGLETSGQQSWSLAKVTTASQPVMYDGTWQRVRFSAIHNGWAADTDGHVWALEGSQYRTNGAYDEAIFFSDRGVINDIWTTVDEDISGDASGTSMWVVGDDGIADEYLRYCRPGDPLFFEEAVVCDAHDLDDFEASSLPQAVAGVADCSILGCQGALVATAADAAASGGNYTDTYENPAPGDSPTWDKGATPNQVASRASRAIAGWGSSDDAQFLAVGTSGYLVHRRSNGSWSAPLQFRADQSRRTFSGVWAGAGVIVVSAHQVPIGDNTKVEYELWTCPLNKDVEVGSNWTLHLLGSGPNVEAAGLYDVGGRSEGELRVVGAIRKANADTPLLDGLIYVRAP